MKRLNVLYLIRAWALGGSHTIIRLLLEHMPKDQFNIITVPYDAPGTGNQDFIDSLRKEGLDVAPERIPWQSRRNWFAARDKVSELIERYDIDLMHCHDTNSNVLCGLGRKRFPCAAIASPYGWWTPKWALRTQLYHWVENNLALPAYDRVYTVSETMKKNVLKGRCKTEQVQVIHTGLDLAHFDKGESREQVRREFQFSKEAVVVGTVSRLFSEKGHRYLLEAAKVLLEDFPQLRIFIVGTGDERKPLERQATELGIRNQVIFSGFYDDLPGALRAMDIFAQPSILHEGFPTAVLEAQVAGLPVVASDIGGTWETIDKDVTGLLCAPAKATDLAAKLRILLEDPQRRQQMADAARPWIENSFTLQHMIQAMTQTYHDAYTDYQETL